MFIFFQPNPLEKQEINKGKRADCAIRSLCVALDITWEEAYDVLCKYAKEIYDVPNGKIGFEYAIQKIGFKIKKLPKIQKGEKRMTVEKFSKVYPDKTAIMNCAGHYVCVKSGNIYDSWDSRTKPIYSYFEFEK